MKVLHKTTRKLSPGKIDKLGATVYPQGVNFALYSMHATAVYLELYEKPNSSPSEIIEIRNRQRHIWNIFVHGIGPGWYYGYRVFGPDNPEVGHRFNPHKLLADPYAKAFSGDFTNKDKILNAYSVDPETGEKALDKRDSGPFVPKSVIVSDDFDWQGDKRPELSDDEMIIYEVHLRGFTAHAGSGVKHKGTFLGFIEKIPYLKELGINAVEFLPIHEFMTEDFLLEKGFENYWGYNTVGFFSPEIKYSTMTTYDSHITEFKTLVRELHKAGIEVILDVVYNHTAEGGPNGPMISFRGIDNSSYYMLGGPPEAPYRDYINLTGCGNTVNLAHYAVNRMVMDSMRYWVEVMHVDGFRFDLASVMGRKDGFFHKSASFFDAVAQDPVLNKVKLIAEPWDLGTYQVGNFPVDWSEWNGRYRDTIRKFIRGDKGVIADTGWRLTGSADLYADDGRTAHHSINFITCHDGFTLHDLVSYDKKHNFANNEENRDGSDENYSFNHGAEGETNHAEILFSRKKAVKNYACALFFSQGAPMMLGGDEIMRSQKGNNNAYCQDNEISWFDWSLLEKNREIFEFFKHIIRFNKQHSFFRSNRHFAGRFSDRFLLPDYHWYGPDGNSPDWENPESRSLGFYLKANPRANASLDVSFFIMFHNEQSERSVVLPSPGKKRSWHRLIDTGLAFPLDFITEDTTRPLENQREYTMKGNSVLVLLGKFA